MLPSPCVSARSTPIPRPAASLLSRLALTLGSASTAVLGSPDLPRPCVSLFAGVVTGSCTVGRGPVLTPRGHLLEPRSPFSHWQAFVLFPTQSLGPGQREGWQAATDPVA